jgi:peptidoglycan hydrolase-like protein with peptidoglycan-binding domain
MKARMDGEAGMAHMKARMDGEAGMAQMAAAQKAQKARRGSKNARQIALSKKTGISIKKMQKDLFDKGFAPHGVSEKEFVDGRPGPSTRQAIEDLQDDLQVKADGLYGPGTHKAWKNQDFAYARRKKFADRGVVDRDVAMAAKKKAAAAQSAGGNIARLRKAVQDAKINLSTMSTPAGGTPVKDPRYKVAKKQYRKAQLDLRKALGQQKLARLKAAQSAKLANRKKASQSGTANIATR